MDWFTGCVLYALIWWTALFAVLPLGTRTVAAPDQASGWRGAPEHPQLVRKAVITTLAAAVVWLGLFLVIRSPYLSFSHGWLAMHAD